jgi:glycerol-3-phosphate dehydrogenase (NAD(P)+)
VGAGAWGTTIAANLAGTGHEVILWAFEPQVVEEINRSHRNSIFLKGVDLPANIRAVNDFSDFRNIEKVIISVPSAFYADTVKSLAGMTSTKAQLLSATKGFVGPDLKRPSELLRELFPTSPIGIMSGPNLAREVNQGLPAITLIASTDENLVKEFQALLATDKFRVYGGADVIGTELGGALKNIIAIAAGIADGLKLGENALAALITRGLAEMIKLGGVLGANERTFYGVSGLGDLVCTSQSRLSRNHEVGRRIAAGEKLKDILAGMKAVAEGVGTTKHVQEYAVSRDLDLPITRSTYSVLFEDVLPGLALRELMTRTLKME